MFLQRDRTRLGFVPSPASDDPTALRARLLGGSALTAGAVALYAAAATLTGQATLTANAEVVTPAIPLAPINVALVPASDLGSTSGDHLSNDPYPELQTDFDENASPGDTIRIYLDAGDTAGPTEHASFALTSDILSNAKIPPGTFTAIPAGVWLISISHANSAGESPRSDPVAYTMNESLGPVALSVGVSDQTSDTTPDCVLDLSGATVLAGDHAEVIAADGTVLGTADLTTATLASCPVTLSTLALGAHTVRGYVWRDDGTFTELQSYTFTINAAVFHPTDLSGLVLLLDASVIGSMFQSNAGSTAVASDADPVGYWADQSGNSFDMSSVADDGTRPTYGTTDNPHVLFDGTDALLRGMSATGVYAAGAATLMFAIKGNPSTGRYLFAENTNTGTLPFYSLTRTNNTTASTADVFVRNNEGAVLHDSGLLLTANAFDNTDNVFTVTDTGSLTTSYLDGSSVDSQAYTRSGTMPVTRTALGGHIANNTPAGWWAGRVYAVAVFSRVLDAGELASMTTWLGAKMGRSL